MAAEKNGQLATTKNENSGLQTNNNSSKSSGVKAKNVSTPSANLKAKSSSDIYNDAFETGKALVNPAKEGMVDGYKTGLGELDDMVTVMQRNLTQGLTDFANKELSDYVK